ncbi:hypothetical protein Hanom_Chr14g01297461 [Helianthus anomalus]
MHTCASPHLALPERLSYKQDYPCMLVFFCILVGSSFSGHISLCPMQLMVKEWSQYPDYVKTFPKPLLASMVEARKKDDLELEEKTENVDHLSAKELLQVATTC